MLYRLGNSVFNQYSFLIILGVSMLMGCSAENTGPISTAYHNTTAHFNPYFIANEHLKEVESSIRSTHDNNFNKILKIFPEIDSATIESERTKLDDCIKKASKVIDWHKNSKWVHPAYIQVGRAYFYMAEFEKAITAYKIVNRDAKGDDVRHTALIHLMRSYIHYNEESNAIAVSDFLKKEDLSKKNKKNLYLTRAHLYQKREDLDNMVKNLVLAVPLMKNNEGKAKIYFIIGQIYQSLGFDAEAYNNYDRCLKSNPDYELSFYAKLNRAQVFELKKTNDLKKIRRYYRKLLTDSKNKEFKDKIYYEMAEFEIKNENLDQAIEHYNSSVRSSVNNQRQKAYSYWKLGQIYFERSKKYQLAKLYYDSTLTSMPKDDESYEVIEKRQKILANFAKQITTIQLQDSLLALAEMDSLTLSAFLDDAIEQKKEEAKRLEKQKRSVANSRVNRRLFDTSDNPFNSEKEDGNAIWYFYNISAVGQGQSEFVRKWGNRPLEDHWRRSSKESVIASEVPSSDPNLNEEPGEETAANGNGEEVFDKSMYYQNIPFTAEAKQEAHKKIEDAYYHLGNIYNFDLEEKVNASDAFDTLLIRYPQTEYKPEVLYLLYIINKDLGNGKDLSYKDQLLNEFPNSIYAKTLINPNYREESKIASEKLKIIYNKAYKEYEAGDFLGAKARIDQALREHEENDFTDNLRLLRVLIIGKTEDIYRYQFELGEFIEKNPDSELLDYANELLETSRGWLQEVASAKETKFVEFFEQSHSFVLVYDFKDSEAKQLPGRIDKFVQDYFSGYGLNTANLILTDTKTIVVINQFQDKARALEFYQAFNGANSPLKGLNSLNFNNFVITKDNFQIFYQTKDVENYLSFFDKFYN
ncbi:methyltransferase [Fulvivirgaceae bacterium BMA10]|uniref:Methyltransferase n=1 Tax=Splendidivirga corallicola TaxID=3051826 RepID=A0ABT8KV74_9BACT|nr:methyltransferase [Fulvivirgaceae bacterium BMA10]